jgi:hypothetical protein
MLVELPEPPVVPVPALLPEPPELAPPFALGGGSAAVEHAIAAKQRVAVEMAARDFMDRSSDFVQANRRMRKGAAIRPDVSEKKRVQGPRAQCGKGQRIFAIWVDSVAPR